MSFTESFTAGWLSRFYRCCAPMKPGDNNLSDFCCANITYGLIQVTMWYHLGNVYRSSYPPDCCVFSCASWLVHFVAYLFCMFCKYKTLYFCNISLRFHHQLYVVCNAGFGNLTLVSLSKHSNKSNLVLLRLLEKQHRNKTSSFSLLVIFCHIKMHNVLKVGRDKFTMCVLQ